MTIDETNRIIRKIKAFRPFFQTGNSSSEERELKKEWHKVLEPYDFEDVDKKLNSYFKNGDNIGKIPEPYYLIKFLKTNNQKKISGELITRCHLCQKEVPEEYFDRHFSRCSSVNYIYNKTKQYFNQEIDKDKLYEMPQGEFDKKYKKFLEQIKTKTTDEKEYLRITRVLKAIDRENVHFDLKENI